MQALPFDSGYFATVVFFFGLLVGSFLNVVIARVPEGMSIVRPRSRCPHCAHGITWYENIPVFSWLALRGRCSACKAPISWRYPAVELLTGFLFLACLWRVGFSYSLLVSLVLVGFLVPLTFIDLDHWILPSAITKSGIVVGLLLSIPLGWARLIDSAIGAALGFFIFWALEVVGEWIFKKEALGGGDKYLLALIGAFLSWRVLLGVVFLSSLQGAIVGSLLLLVRGRAGPAPKPEDTSSAEASAEGEPTAAAVEPISKPEGEPAPTPLRTEAVEPEDVDEEEEDDWEPGPTNMPFGPWLAIAALELVFFAPWLARLPGGISLMLTGS